MTRTAEHRLPTSPTEPVRASRLGPIQGASCGFVDCFHPTISGRCRVPHDDNGPSAMPRIERRKAKRRRDRQRAMGERRSRIASDVSAPDDALEALGSAQDHERRYSRLNSTIGESCGPHAIGIVTLSALTDMPGQSRNRRSIDSARAPISAIRWQSTEKTKRLSVLCGIFILRTISLIRCRTNRTCRTA